METLHVIYQQMMQKTGALLLKDAIDWDQFLAQHPEKPHIVLIAGDGTKHPECLDVAVILPELIKHHQADCMIALQYPANDESIAQKWAVQRRPALIFFTQGCYAKAIEGMLDWEPFCTQFAKALQSPPSRPPIAIIKTH